MPYSNWSLEKRFAILSFISLTCLGTLILLGNMWFLSQQLVTSAARYSQTLTDSVIRHHFQESDFNGDMSGQRYDELASFFQRDVLQGEIKRIKVWDSQGTIVFSDEKRIIGQSFPVEEDLQKALSGEVYAAFSKMNELEQLTEQQFGGKLLEVYVPIFQENKKSVLGAFELYIDDQALIEQISYNSSIIVISVIGSLFILWIALIGIVRKASATISTQSEQLNKVYNKLDLSLVYQEKNQVGVIKALLATIDAKDHYTAGHSYRVAKYAVRIGKEIGLSDAQLKTLKESALFHDIGKVGIGEAILNKPGSFSEEEYFMMQKHPVIGFDIINSIPAFTQHAKIIRHHHERIDGKGYPDGLRGDNIPVEARILALADTYDALTTTRPYRKAKPKNKALSIMKEVAGSQLDEELVAAFLK